MNWIDDILQQIGGPGGWGYRPGSQPATEPTALAALALWAHGRQKEADLARRWLVSAQAADGSLGVGAQQPTPRWSTGLAVLAWRAAALDSNSLDTLRPYRLAINRAVQWIEGAEGTVLPLSTDVGHDSTLKGWPWVLGTHSWVEPTALCLLALKAAGHGSRSRAREAVRLLVDRLLPTGGCNYGNTVVLGQTLKPHLEPTGVVLLALAGETDRDGRIENTLDYVEEALGSSTTAYSLAYGLMGLAAHGRMPPNVDGWLEAAAERTRRYGAWLPRLTLLTLAARKTDSPLVTLPSNAATTTSETP